MNLPDFLSQRLPLPPPRRHEHRFDQRLDVRLARVMSAELRALLRLDRPLEQRSHDARLDELPIGLRRLGQQADFLLGQFKDRCLLE